MCVMVKRVEHFNQIVIVPHEYVYFNVNVNMNSTVQVNTLVLYLFLYILNAVYNVQTTVQSILHLNFKCKPSRSIIAQITCK